MSLRIIKTGVLDSIQDAGRFGWQFQGVNPTGVMDRFSASIANMLAGNNPDAATIELHFPASVFLFERPALIALGGADFAASVNGEPVPSLHPIIVNKDSLLLFSAPLHGARTYLAIKGGIDSDEWLGSQSTHLQAMIGGYHGRSLHKNDQLFFKINIDYSSILQNKEFVVLPWKVDQARENGSENSNELFVLPGREWDWLDEKSKADFLSASFTISQQSDRMGYRLNDIPLHVVNSEDLVSSAVSFGTVQLLPNGQLIILMADHQTTGGYPKIAHIISAHQSKAAQLKAGDKIHFRMTDQQTAERLLLKQQLHLLQLQNACTFRLDEFFNK